MESGDIIFCTPFASNSDYIVMFECEAVRPRRNSDGVIELMVFAVPGSVVAFKTPTDSITWDKDKPIMSVKDDYDLVSDTRMFRYHHCRVAFANEVARYANVIGV